MRIASSGHSSPRRLVSTSLYYAFVIACATLLAFVALLPILPETGTGWGRWALELVETTAAGALLFLFLNRYFPLLSSGFAAAAFLANIAFAELRQPDISGLLLHVIVYLLLTEVITRQHAAVRNAVLLGAMVGLAVLLGFPGLALTSTAALVAAAWDSQQPHRWFSPAWSVLASLLVVLIGAAVTASSPILVKILPPGQWFANVSGFAGTVWEAQTISGFFALGLLSWFAGFLFLLQRLPRLRTILASRWIGFAVVVFGLVLFFNGLYDDVNNTLFSWKAISLYRVGMMVGGFVFIITGLLWYSRSVRGRAAAILQPEERKEGVSFLLPLQIAVIDLVVIVLLSAILPLHAVSLTGYPALAVLVAFLLFSITGEKREGAERGMAFVWTAILGLVVIFPGLWSALW